MVLLLAAMYWALATDNRGALWLAYAAFALEIFALYWRTLGTLLNTSLFFLVAAAARQRTRLRRLAPAPAQDADKEPRA